MTVLRNLVTGPSITRYRDEVGQAMDILPPGWKTGLAGAQSVASMEEAAALMDELRALPEFLFGYVAPGFKPKVIVFLDAETYGDKRPRGMVEMLIPGSLAR